MQYFSARFRAETTFWPICKHLKLMKWKSPGYLWPFYIQSAWWEQLAPDSAKSVVTSKNLIESKVWIELKGDSNLINWEVDE